MAAITNTVQTYGVKGLREQLSDMIYNISPTETPFVSNAARGKVDGTFNEWQLDALAAPNTANQKIEGDDITSFDAIAPTTRVGNYTQISNKTVLVSGTEERVQKAGRKSELGYQVAKKGKEMKRDIEAMLLQNLGASAGNATTARVTGSLLAFIKTNTDKGASGVDPVYTTAPTGTRTDGTQRAFTETILKNVVSLCWTAGGDPSTLMVGAGNKVVASGFAGIATKYKEVKGTSQGVIIGAADVYVHDFGELVIVPNRFQRNRDAFVLDFEFISVDYLRPFNDSPLAKTGDAEKRMLLAEYMLRVKNEAALGLAADLS
jgi:hypothetical protein